MLKKLYQTSLKLASHKSSKFFLALISFIESSFFPIPPDIMIVPMVISKKRDYIKIFLIATISSAMGGLLGYFIGSTFLDLAMSLIEFYGYEEKVKILKNNLSQGPSFYLFLGTLFLAGFTPLPFKVFTITSGIIGLNILAFFVICLASRGLRFFVLSYLCYKFGHRFDQIIHSKNVKWFIFIILILIIIFGVIYFFNK